MLVLGWRLVQAEQTRTQQQFEDLLQANLIEIDRDIVDYFATLEARLLQTPVQIDNLQALRETIREEPLIDQAVVLDPEGRIIYPAMDSLSQQESRFLLKLEQLLTDRIFRNSVAATADTRTDESATTSVASSRVAQGNIASPLSLTPNSTPREHGWYTWYWGSGIQLIHWRRLNNQATLIIGVRRSRWIADIIAKLPDSSYSDASTAPAQIRVLDSDGDIIYLWGARLNPDVGEPVTSRHLSAPLKPWQLQHFGPVRSLEIGNAVVRWNLIVMGTILSLGLFGMAIYLGREVGQQMRDARERVSFVNQVSHELKTPLTNIRMYAELVAKDLQRIDPDDLRAKSHVEIITSESRRLSRLIRNVLTFAGRERVNSPYRTRPGVVDDVIQSVVEQFRPSLDQLQFRLVFDLDAPTEVMLDRDALEQMLSNIISNAEKYAASGKHLRIRSRFQKDTTFIDVADAGPGVSGNFAKRIFQPFERASDHIHSATGTGIGLTITRSLARKHGGELQLQESTLGATFRLTLHTPISPPGNTSKRKGEP